MNQLIVEMANPAFAIGALIFLLFVFLGILYWVFVKNPKSKYEERAQLPFEDEPQKKKESKGHGE